MTLAEVFRTAAEQFDPSDGIDLIGMLITITPSIIAAVGVIIVGVITVRGQKRGRERWKGDRKMLNDVHRQTVNDHPEEENMREQLDRIEQKQNALHGQVSEMRSRQIDQGRNIGDIRADIGGIRDDVGDLRGADRIAQQDHTDLVRRLNAFIRREHPGADPL